MMLSEPRSVSGEWLAWTAGWQLMVTVAGASHINPLPPSTMCWWGVLPHRFILCDPTCVDFTFHGSQGSCYFFFCYVSTHSEFSGREKRRCLLVPAAQQWQGSASEWRLEESHLRNPWRLLKRLSRLPSWNVLDFLSGGAVLAKTFSDLKTFVKDCFCGARFLRDLPRTDENTHTHTHTHTHIHAHTHTTLIG